MFDRLGLHEALCEVLGSRNVYFQPPATVKMKYPAIVYSLNRIDTKHANDEVYIQSPSYSLILIDSNPDNETVEKLLKLPHCRFDRFYTSDNLNHYSFTIYY